MQVWCSGRVVGYRSEGCWFAPSLCSLVFRGHRASNVKLRILECFTLYLRNRQSGNLRAIENCICGLRSIERNMRSFLRTVCSWLLSRRIYIGSCQAQCSVSTEYIHRKKKVREFPVPSRDVTTKLSLGGNNDVITELFLPRGSLVSDIPAGDGKHVNLFLRCIEPCWRTFQEYLFYTPKQLLSPAGRKFRIIL